jgi:hypothetical protein
MNGPALRFMEVTKRLDKLVQEALKMQDEERKEILLSFVLFRLLDEWGVQSCRIVLESYGGAEAAMRESLRHSWGTKPQKEDWEPSWHVPEKAMRAAELLGVPDLDRIQGTIGSVIYADDLRCTRNAVVHSGPVALGRYEEMALDRYLLRNIVPYGMPLQTNYRTGKPIYEDWCDELQDALQLALQ